RMLPHLSPEQACDLHCELTRWTCRQLLDSGLGAVELAVAGDGDHALFSECKGQGVSRIVRQRGADLGERMYNALRCGLARYDSVILVGSDCPGIDASYLCQAVSALRAAPVVLGPAHDGGYVLIGARAIQRAMFEDIPWGSGQVFDRTTAALAREGVCWEELPQLADIDRPEDLPVWEALRQAANPASR
ncbi:MAG: TIGR04282 family arsenosugar biosynthesis glycosyltransferase, partial [Halioglobus sp.]|nr:TIGR04282 family arsenosugar biosynthesis glycosyltransferase [Halioglobus sp.]